MYNVDMIVIKHTTSEEKYEKTEGMQDARGSDIVHGTHETHNSEHAKKAAHEIDVSVEKYGNEWE